MLLKENQPPLVFSLLVQMLHEGKDENVFAGLNDPFYGVDSRDYQVIQPFHNMLRKMGGRMHFASKRKAACTTGKGHYGHPIFGIYESATVPS